MTNAERQARYRERKRQARKGLEKAIKENRRAIESYERRLAEFENGTYRLTRDDNGEFVDVTHEEVEYYRSAAAQFRKLNEFLEAARDV